MKKHGMIEGGPEGAKMPDRSDMLANERVGKLLWKLSTPAIIGMMVHGIYNVVDAIFVGRYAGTLGIGGIAIAMPIHMTVMAIGLGIGMGGASIISRRLGEGNREEAYFTLGNMVLLSLLSGVICLLTGLLVLDPLTRFFGANEALLPYSMSYLFIILLGSPVITFSMATSSAARAEGNARVAMTCMLIGAVLNIILDAIFIAAFGLGVKGAAIATVLSMVVSALYLLIYFLGGKSELSFRMEYIHFKWHIVKEIFIIGLSDFVRTVAMSLTMALYNNVLRRYGGEIPIAVFGIFFRITSFIFMPMMGIAQGAQPIFGFNFGAKKHDRVKKALRLANASATVIGVVGFMIFMFFPESLYLIFSSDPELVSMGKGALRILVLGFPFVGFQMIAMNLFQALGMARYALFTSLARQVLFLIPMVLILPLIFGLTGVWISFPLADIVSFIVTFILVFITVKGLSHDRIEIHNE